MAHLVLHPGFKTLIISIFLSSLLCKFVAADIGTISSCITNSTADTTYLNNLQTLFSNLTSSSLSFYNSTAGESPNKAYALYLCRGDVSSDVCRTCVKSITDALSSQQFGVNCKEGFMYMDDCMLHYANNSFFGISNNNDSPQSLGNFSTTNYVAYNTTLQSVLKGVITDAANNATLFATREGGVEGDGQEKVYALAQCTQDLDRGNCSGCLNAAFATLNNITTSLPGVVKSAAALLPSCQLRYDNVTFYSSASSSPPAAAVSAFLVATFSFFLIHLLLC